RTVRETSGSSHLQRASKYGTSVFRAPLRRSEPRQSSRANEATRFLYSVLDRQHWQASWRALTPHRRPVQKESEPTAPAGPTILAIASALPVKNSAGIPGYSNAAGAEGS